MKKLNVIEAAKFCIDTNFSVDHWSCGYILEILLETECNIVLETDTSWRELEDILYYNELQ